MLDLFSVPVFVVVFRETLETAIIVSVLLAFLKQTLDGSQHDAVYKTLRTQVSFLSLCRMKLIVRFGLELPLDSLSVSLALV